MAAEGIDYALEATDIDYAHEATDIDYTSEVTGIDCEVWYKLCTCSLGQIIKSLKITKERLSEKEEKTKIDSWLIMHITYLIGHYNQLIEKGEESGSKVRFNILTSRLPRDVRIEPDTCNIEIRNAKIGMLIKQMLQRINFIINREVPNKYITSDGDKHEFETLQQDLIKFKIKVNQFKKGFVSVVKDAREEKQTSET